LGIHHLAAQIRIWLAPLLPPRRTPRHAGGGEEDRRGGGQKGVVGTDWGVGGWRLDIGYWLLEMTAQISNIYCYHSDPKGFSR
jgi:hypothetical protein